MSWGEDGLIWNAVTEAVEPIVHLETEIDRNKLEKRIRDAFTKGAKGLSFGKKGFEELANDYADNVFGALFQGFGEKDWISQADFLLVIDAGVKDFFPPPMIKSVPQVTFERAVLQATDRAFDEARSQSCIWSAVTSLVEGNKTPKKVRECCEEGRAEAVKQGLGSMADFLSTWIFTTIEILAPKAQGDPESALSAELACQLFDTMCQEGGLPMHFTEEEGLPPPGWEIIEQAVSQAYAPYATEEQVMAPPMHMKGGMKGGKFGGKGYSPY